MVNSNQQKLIIANPKQQECIDTIDGAVMVLAGPGTGKTFTIIQRIKHMLQKGILPETILCLTFSEAAANEMKIRLVKEVGAEASSVEISTYHAFCSGIISQYPSEFELGERFEVIDELEKYKLMKESIDEYKPKYLLAKDYNPYYYVFPLLDSVNEIKRSRTSEKKYFQILESDWGTKLQELLEDKKEQEELAKLGKRNHLKGATDKIIKLEDTINKAKEAWEVIQIYRKKMLRKNLIDFNDMINLVLEVFESNPEFRAEVKSKYKYLLIDEYQDTNKSQNELIFSLAGEEPSANVMVVGDDDQIIFRFQGANTNNLELFLQKYPNTKMICLNENNRSTQVILDLSREVLRQTPARLEDNMTFEKFEISKKLTAKNSDVISKERKAELHTFFDSIHEINFIIDKIQEIIKENPDLPLSEIAVLAKTNQELELFADTLKNKEIPFQTNKKKDIFSLKPSLLTYLYLKAIDNNKLYGAGLFGILGHPPFNLNPEDYAFLVKQAKIYRKDFITLMKENLKTAKWTDRERIEKFVNTFDEIKEFQGRENLYNLILQVLNKTGILNYFVQNSSDIIEDMAAIKKLTDEARNFGRKNPSKNLSDFLEHLDISIKEGINLEIDEENLVKNAVQLVTAHKSKGREFSYVFIYNTNSKNWEEAPNREKLKIPTEKTCFSDDLQEDKLAESGRLLFVAITRAKYGLFLSHPLTTNQKLSKFISHLCENNSFLNKKVHELKAEEIALEYKKFFDSPAIYINSSYLEELRAHAKSHVMSATSLRDYEDCSRKFLYAHIYKIPSIDYINPNLSFGSCIHKAIEICTKTALEKNEYPSKEFMISFFKDSLDRHPFEFQEQKENFVTKGENAVNNFYESFIITPIKNILSSEMNFNDIPFGENFIDGKIDRIERNESGNLTVIDFKTGSPKTKSSIENGENAYLLDQLRFYKLLYETKFPQTKIEKGSIVFVEEPKAYDFELTEEDIELIKEKISQTYEKINKLEIEPLDRNEQKNGCKFCNYKLLCKLNCI